MGFWKKTYNQLHDHDFSRGPIEWDTIEGLIKRLEYEQIEAASQNQWGMNTTLSMAECLIKRLYAECEYLKKENDRLNSAQVQQAE